MASTSTVSRFATLARGAIGARVARVARVAFVAFVVACSRADSERPSVSNTDTGFRGVVLSPPYAKPDFTLTDFDGRRFDFRRETEGKVALLFFGYTHCPDVCPLHAANVAAVLRDLPPEQAGEIRFVFVTTDPERDTPARLKEWLGNFHPSFVGLSGSVDEINGVLSGLRMPPIERGPPTADSAGYLVGHGAQVIAFGKDGMARVEYPFGVRQEDWAHDLPRLARGEVPNAPMASRASAVPAGDGAALAAEALAAGTRAPIQVAGAVVPVPATLSEGALYLVLRNSGAEDTLAGIVSEAVTSAQVHETVRQPGGMMGMAPAADVVVRAGETLQLKPGGAHVMLFGFRRKPEVGESIPVLLRFRRAGDVVFAATVVPYTDVEAVLDRASAPPGK